MSRNLAICGELLQINEYPWGKNLIAKDNPQVSESLNIGWLAGILDGEGSITLLKAYKRKTEWYVPHIRISNTDPNIIDRVVDILKSLEVGFYRYEQPPKKSNYKPLQHIVITGMKRVKKFLDLIGEYLVGKKSQAIVVRAFINYRSDKHGGNCTQYPYGEEERAYVQLCRQLKETAHLRDFMPGKDNNSLKIKSDLLGDKQTAPEMSAGVS